MLAMRPRGDVGMADLAQHLNLLSQLGCLGDRLPADDLTAMFNIIELTKHAEFKAS